MSLKRYYLGLQEEIIKCTTTESNSLNDNEFYFLLIQVKQAGVHINFVSSFVTATYHKRFTLKFNFCYMIHMILLAVRV